MINATDPEALSILSLGQPKVQPEIGRTVAEVARANDTLLEAVVLASSLEVTA